MDPGLISYLSAAVAFALLAVLLLTSWRGGVRGGLLALTVLVNAIWAAFASQVNGDVSLAKDGYEILEIVRYLVWYLFLLKLLDAATQADSSYARFQRRSLFLALSYGCLLMLLQLGYPALSGKVAQSDLVTAVITAHLFLPVIGLVIIEQLFRNTSVKYRWAVKYLFIGAGGIFAYDFYLYSNALLFREMNPGLWEARGFVNVLAVPMLALSAARNRDWSLNIFVSRDIALHTTVVLGGGAYLLAMAAAGYYLKEYGGSWGVVAQVVFLSLAAALLLSAMFSGQLRARLRVFLAKHFYRNKYDYRQEWLRLTGDLEDQHGGDNRFEAAVRVLARIVEARSAYMWISEDGKQYQNVVAWNGARIEHLEPADGALVRFLQNKAYIINLRDMASRQREYEGLDLPQWLQATHRPWLIVPLFTLKSLMGFVVLADPLISRDINWEDRDLLKTAAKQVASYITILMTSEALAEAKQFEVFNRLSAYMVHDLKNIAAELELIGRNADRHRGNPAFLEDAFETVSNASADINRLLAQLRSKQIADEKKVVVDLCALAREVAGKKGDRRPVPVVEGPDSGCLVVTERSRLSSVLAHLLDNAQQATPEEGQINISIYGKESFNVVEIKDNGHGMDEDFIRSRLFKPFDTTKGNAGMGIGMYESREFIRQAGGDINVESQPGQGTCVRLQIPAYAS